MKSNEPGKYNWIKSEKLFHCATSANFLRPFKHEMNIYFVRNKNVNFPLKSFAKTTGWDCLPQFLFVSNNPYSRFLLRSHFKCKPHVCIINMRFLVGYEKKQQTFRQVQFFDSFFLVFSHFIELQSFHSLHSTKAYKNLSKFVSDWLETKRSILRETL